MSTPSLASLVVEKSPVLRDSVSALLANTGAHEVLAGVGSRDEALEHVNERQPDLVVMGPRMGGFDSDGGGAELVGAIRAASPGTSVLLTVSNREAERAALVRGIESGATGVFDLSAPTESFLEALRVVAEGGTHLSPDIAIGLLGGGGPESKLGSLTDRELDVLKELALGYTNAEIAESLHLSVRTVESHRARLQGKLGLTTRAELVRVCLDAGLVY